MSDPWKHRSENMCCETCMWCAVKETKGPKKSKLGRCRKHSPTLNGYPVVYMNDWCGDHKLDETKI